MKIAVLCGPTSQGFLAPVEKLLRSGGHEVKRFTTVEPTTRAVSPIAATNAVNEWKADAAWIEWLDSSAVHFSRVLTIPMVVRMHRFEAETEWPAKMDWRAVRLVVTSRHILARAERRCEHGLAKWARPVIIPSIVDFDAFPLVEERDNDPAEVAVVGFREGRKQPGLAIAAFASIQHRLPNGARLRFIGREKEPGWDNYLAADRHVAIEPWADDVAAIWKTAEVCLSASADEGCPYNVIEAMACGAMPLVHQYEGAEDQFPRECLWWLPRDAATALQMMLKWQEKDLRAWAFKRYSIEANRDAVLGLFR